MQNQKYTTTTGTDYTVSTLTLGELRMFDDVFTQQVKPGEGISALLRFTPVFHASLRKVHQDLTREDLENNLTLEDINPLLSVVMEVSGLKKPEKPAGEAQPVTG